MLSCYSFRSLFKAELADIVARLFRDNVDHFGLLQDLIRLT
jgi:hypothetical protein